MGRGQPEGLGPQPLPGASSRVVWLVKKSSAPCSAPGAASSPEMYARGAAPSWQQLEVQATPVGLPQVSPWKCSSHEGCHGLRPPCGHPHGQYMARTESDGEGASGGGGLPVMPGAQPSHTTFLLSSGPTLNTRPLLTPYLVQVTSPPCPLKGSSLLQTFLSQGPAPTWPCPLN